MCLSEGIVSIDFNLVKWEFRGGKFVIECEFENNQSELDKETGMVKEKKPCFKMDQICFGMLTQRSGAWWITMFDLLIWSKYEKKIFYNWRFWFWLFFSRKTSIIHGFGLKTIFSFHKHMNLEYFWFFLRIFQVVVVAVFLKSTINRDITIQFTHKSYHFIYLFKSCNEISLFKSNKCTK